MNVKPVKNSGLRVRWVVLSLWYGGCPREMFPDPSGWPLWSGSFQDPLLPPADGDPFPRDGLEVKIGV